MTDWKVINNQKKKYWYSPILAVCIRRASADIITATQRSKQMRMMNVFFSSSRASRRVGGSLHYMITITMIISPSIPVVT